MVEFIKAISPGFTSVGLICALIYIVIKEFRSGSNDVEKKTLDAYKERNSQLEKEIPRLHADVKKNGEDIARLRGALDEKDKHIKSLTDILQDKNPEVLALLKEIRDFMHTFNDQTKKILDYQTEMIEGQIMRDTKVDKANE